MRRDVSVALAVAWAGIASAVNSSRADACAVVRAPSVEVHVASEQALIVWDPANKRQDFIRRSTFGGDAQRFGFLVPVPSVPDISEVNAEIFERLHSRTRPRITPIHEGYDFELESLLLLPLARKSAPTAASVSVVAQARVGDYLASVLEADSNVALAEWLAPRGFARSDALDGWLKHYVDQKWKLVAFEFKGEANSAFASKAIRLSFQTERPFYPYREPQGGEAKRAALSVGEQRSLQLFFIGPSKVDAAFGASAGWNASVKMAGSLGIDLGFDVKAPPSSILTFFEDRQDPRPGTEDLFFVPAADAKLFEHTQISKGPRRVPVFIEGVVGIAVIIGIALVVRRRAQVA